jgi:hypothetical protein
VETELKTKRKIEGLGQKNKSNTVAKDGIIGQREMERKVSGLN